MLAKIEEKQVAKYENNILTAETTQHQNWSQRELEPVIESLQIIDIEIHCHFQIDRKRMGFLKIWYLEVKISIFRFCSISTSKDMTQRVFLTLLVLAELIGKYTSNIVFVLFKMNKTSIQWTLGSQVYLGKRKKSLVKNDFWTKTNKKNA